MHISKVACRSQLLSIYITVQSGVLSRNNLLKKHILVMILAYLITIMYVVIISGETNVTQIQLLHLLLRCDESKIFPMYIIQNCNHCVTYAIDICRETHYFHSVLFYPSIDKYSSSIL